MLTGLALFLLFVATIGISLVAIGTRDMEE
jgi:hypothetical protein